MDAAAAAEQADIEGPVETRVRGRPRRLRIVVESVEINPALDDARFQMPR